MNNWKDNNYTFEMYLIMVGIRSMDFTFEDNFLYENIEYFKDCYNKEISAYYALTGLIK